MEIKTTHESEKEYIIAKKTFIPTEDGMIMVCLSHFGSICAVKLMNFVSRIVETLSQLIFYFRCCHRKEKLSLQKDILGEYSELVSVCPWFYRTILRVKDNTQDTINTINQTR